MTSLAQCLLDAGKFVGGADVAEEFVTQEILKRLNIKIDVGFAHELPYEIDCVIYTAAHFGPDNALVKQAHKKGIATYSHAQALGELFNDKDGIAVCGVGGKSTVSAMITWILAKTSSSVLRPPSFSVGVGDINGLGKTGQWRKDSQYFVAEADEYVTDPMAVAKGEEITPRFSYLNPKITICTNLEFDHPDVYRDFAHTKEIFKKFFQQLKVGGSLIINADDPELKSLSQELKDEAQIYTFGKNKGADAQLLAYQVTKQQAECKFIINANSSTNKQTFTMKLNLPGKFNCLNALAAILATQAAGVPVATSIQALASFQSTKRRFEFIGKKNNVLYYDDYAHHPAEISAMIEAMQTWLPNKRLFFAFQPHTYSRTKQLLPAFAQALAQAKRVILLDIFASARETDDPSISSDILLQACKQENPYLKIKKMKNIKGLARFCKMSLKSGDVLITLGAGDIYKVHQLIK